MDPKIVLIPIACLWVIVAAVVIGYPLMTGRVRSGLTTLSRETDPQAFWRAYMLSTILFLSISVAAVLFLHAIFHRPS
jgi:hypothetical protein